MNNINIIIDIQKTLLQLLQEILSIPIVFTLPISFPCGYIKDLICRSIENNCYECNFTLSILSKSTSNFECLTLLNKLITNYELKNALKIQRSNLDLYSIKMSNLYIQTWTVEQEENFWQAKTFIKTYAIYVK